MLFCIELRVYSLRQCLLFLFQFHRVVVCPASPPLPKTGDRALGPLALTDAHIYAIYVPSLTHSRKTQEITQPAPYPTLLLSGAVPLRPPLPAPSPLTWVHRECHEITSRHTAPAAVEPIRRSSCLPREGQELRTHISTDVLLSRSVHKAERTKKKKKKRTRNQ